MPYKLRFAFVIWSAFFVLAGAVSGQPQKAYENCPNRAQNGSPHKYEIAAANILKDGTTTSFRGINAMHVFNPSDPSLDDWSGISIVREFVGDLKHTPINRGERFRDPAHKWTLHAIQDLVDNNRKRGFVTVICPMNWDADKQHEFSGCNPRSQSWYAGYKSRMQDWAAAFKGQSDVWIEVMNEPFHPISNPQECTDWLETMRDMVNNLRTAGWDGIILIPGSGWGQDEFVIEKMGHQLLQGQRNLLFDVHIYDRWLNHPDEIPNRYRKMQDSQLPFIFGELGPGAHDDHVCDPGPFIHFAEEHRLSLLAWGWGTWGGRHPINLQTNEGGPNDNGNFNWGSAFKAFLARSSNKKGPDSQVQSTRQAAVPLVVPSVTESLYTGKNEFPTSQPPAPESHFNSVVVEAENAKKLQSCRIAQLPNAFTGSGTVVFDSPQAEAKWSVAVPAPGRYLIALKYCLTSTEDAAVSVEANGGPVHVLKLVGIPNFYGAAQSWYADTVNQNWRFSASPIDLHEGSNLVSLSVKPGSGGFALDNLSISSEKRPNATAPYFDPKSYGAKGDGLTLDTAAVQKCIDKCQGTGGTVLLKNGRFLTGTLHLRSKMTLWIDSSATLLGSKNSADYTKTDGQIDALLEGASLSECFITGGGMVDGQGDASVWSGKKDTERASLVRIGDSRNLSLTKLDLRRAACWSVVFNGCDNVKVNAVNITSLSHPNRDGLDPCDCHHFRFTNSSILSDDDALCLKSFTSTGVEDFSATNVSLTSGANAIKFGSDTYGSFKNCHFRDVTITRSGTGISVGIADGAEVGDVRFKNIRMGSVFVPLSILQGAGIRTKWPHKPRPLKQMDRAGTVHDLVFEDIHATARKQFASCITGVSVKGEVYRVQDVKMTGVSVENQEGYGGNNVPPEPREYAGEYPDYSWMGFPQLPSSGLYVRHAKNLKIEDCQFTSAKPDSRKPVVLDDVTP